jgi:uncharacterized membrane protein YfcA
MPVVTSAMLAIVFAAGCGAGGLGALLGIGGGVLLVPFLNLVLGLSITRAAAISLITVIATSSSVSARRAGERLINLRLGMLLEVATAAGSLTGGLTAELVSQTSLQRLFGIVAAGVALTMIGRLNRRNVILDPSISPGLLGGRFYEEESGQEVAYQVRRLPIGLAASFVAGNVSSLLGIGGGVVKVPVLNAWCGVPMRAAAATSAFMIGVTAAAGAIIYYGRGQLIPSLAAAAVLGVQAGSFGGLRVSDRISVRWLKLLMTAVLMCVAVLMFVRAGA